MESRRRQRSARIDEAATDSAGGGGSEAKEAVVAADRPKAPNGTRSGEPSLGDIAWLNDTPRGDEVGMTVEPWCSPSLDITRRGGARRPAHLRDHENRELNVFKISEFTEIAA